MDLYLIHWPVPGCYTDTWKALEKLQTQGRVKSIGVSNFHIHDLEMLKKVSDVVPAVNQVEFHPLFNQPELLSYCRENNIAVQAMRLLPGAPICTASFFWKSEENTKRLPHRSDFAGQSSREYPSFPSPYTKNASGKMRKSLIFPDP